MIVAFTGHRPDKLGGYSDSPTQSRVRTAIAARLTSLRQKHGIEIQAISGMALGVDQWAAEICIELRIPFIAALPHTGQELRWPEESQRKYHEILKHASDLRVVSPGAYAPHKMQKRNEWMVDRCHLLLAVWDGTPGGTANCVAYAQKKNKPIENLWQP